MPCVTPSRAVEDDEYRQIYFDALDHITREMFEDPQCFNDLLKMFKQRDKNEKLLVPNIIKICKLLLVNPDRPVQH